MHLALWGLVALPSWCWLQVRIAMLHLVGPLHVTAWRLPLQLSWGKADILRVAMSLTEPHGSWTLHTAEACALRTCCGPFATFHAFRGHDWQCSVVTARARCFGCCWQSACHAQRLTLPHACLQVVLKARGPTCQLLSCQELIHWAWEGPPWLPVGAGGPGLQVTMRPGPGLLDTVGQLTAMHCLPGCLRQTGSVGIADALRVHGKAASDRCILFCAGPGGRGGPVRPGRGYGGGFGRGAGYRDLDEPANQRPLLDYGDL